FYGAFKKNNPGTKRKVVDEIYGKLKDKNGFLEALVELYNEPLESLFEEQDEGNVEWGKNW
ncbi:MAG TPA: DUF5055 domain-containing protein, partial [Treponemataceae bacterium]|nr:DUF5055 domain-containing protein [Treponemataceae bacterium]